MTRIKGGLLVVIAALALGALIAIGLIARSDDDDVGDATISCEAQLSAQRPFDPTTEVPTADNEFPAPEVEGRAIDFARVTCSDPVGDGAQYDEFVLVPEEMPPPTGEGGLRFTMYTEFGSIDGVWDVSFAATNPCEFNFEIDVTWTGGTGAFDGISGTGSGTGDFTDIENTPDCRAATFNYEVEATGVPENPEAAFADVDTTDGNVSCEVELSAQQPFDPTSEIPTADSDFPAPEGRGIDFGRVICDDPVGDGAQYDEFVLVPEGGPPPPPDESLPVQPPPEEPPPPGSGGMRYTIYTTQGSIDGVWEVTYAPTDFCEFNFGIESTWIGGTGAFADVEGTGSGSGEFTRPELEAPFCFSATFNYDMEATGLPTG